MLDKAEFAHDLSDVIGEVVVVAFFLGHVGKQVVDEGHEERLVLVCRKKTIWSFIWLDFMNSVRVL